MSSGRSTSPRHLLKLDESPCYPKFDLLARACSRTDVADTLRIAWTLIELLGRVSDNDSLPQLHQDIVTRLHFEWRTPSGRGLSQCLHEIGILLQYRLVHVSLQRSHCQRYDDFVLYSRARSDLGILRSIDSGSVGLPWVADPIHLLFSYVACMGQSCLATPWPTPRSCLRNAFPARQDSSILLGPRNTSG